jgi:hypothetical protein
MSLVICQRCSAQIDPANDLECYVEVGNMRNLHKTEIMCEPCRDKYYEEFNWDSETGAP